MKDAAKTQIASQKAFEEVLKHSEANNAAWTTASTDSTLQGCFEYEAGEDVTASLFEEVADSK